MVCSKGCDFMKGRLIWFFDGIDVAGSIQNGWVEQKKSFPASQSPLKELNPQQIWKWEPDGTWRSILWQGDSTLMKLNENDQLCHHIYFFLITYWIWRGHTETFHTAILLIRAQVTWTSCSTRSLASSRATFRCGKKIPHRLALARIRLVGVWTNPFEKYSSKWESSRNGVKITNIKYIYVYIYIYKYIWNHHLDRIWKHNNIKKKSCLVTFLRELSKKPSLPTS